MSGTELKIAVIGAGPCGLTACKTLQEFGLAFDCFEASDRVGGVWNVEQGGSGYRSLQTNTSTGAMAFSDFPFAADSPVHPSAYQMVDYFRAYAEHFSILDKIRFNSKVKAIVPSADGSWTIELEGDKTHSYSNVIVATGKYAKPKLPSQKMIEGFAGTHFHANEYLDSQSPLDLRGKRVIVVGLGSSAAEIASDLADPSSTNGQAAKVMLSARSGRWVIPKIIDGKPADATAPHPTEKLPWLFRVLPSTWGVWLMRRAVGKIFRSQFETLQSMLVDKLPQPEIAPWADRPTLSSDFIPLLQTGDIELRPGITSFEGKQVNFNDGTSNDADAIIYATGYSAHLPYLSDKTLGCSAENLRLYQRIAHPEQEGLFFIGYCPVMCSMWPVAEQQSRWVARLLTGAFQLPRRSLQGEKAVHLETSLPVICGFYVDQLRKEAKGLD